MKTTFDSIRDKISKVEVVNKIGCVKKVVGLLIESLGPDVGVGDLCGILNYSGEKVGVGEVVGFKDNNVLLMALDNLNGIKSGYKIQVLSHKAYVPVGKGLLGRIIDGLGNPIDGKGRLNVDFEDRLYSDAPNAILRKKIKEQIETGVRVIDTFLPIGYGQRMGLFAGSGVGKSTLLGMIARNIHSDINVISLIGERGRELREFIEDSLGEEGLKRSVIVISTSDQPAPLRVRASFLAMGIAEYFRDEGLNVMLMMDSLTRLAMAQREIGLTTGEPPTARGYTPSVFSLLSKILERSGNNEKGSITGLYTVLMEGDDINDPLTDAVRAILDGHIFLNRNLANQNIYPAIDILGSISRLEKNILNEKEQGVIGKAKEYLSVYKNNEDLINIGAYVSKSNQKIDKAIEKYLLIEEFLKQKSGEFTRRNDSFLRLGKIVE